MAELNNKTMKKIFKIILLTLTLVPSLSLAQTTAPNGGTGLTTYTAGDIIYAATTNPIRFTKLGIGALASCLTSTGSIPAWATCSSANFFTNIGSNTLLNTGTNLQAPTFQGTSTTVASIFPFASTTAISATTICFTGDLPCRTTWPTSGGSSFPTSTNPLMATYFVATSTTQRSIFGDGGLTSTGNVGIGVTSPASLLTVSKQSTTQSPISGSIAQFVGQDANPLRFTLDTHNNSNTSGTAVMFRRSRGTSATPLADTTDDVLGSLNFRGYGTTGYAAGSTALMTAKAEGAFTDTSMATAITFDTTATTSVTAVERVRISGEGNLGVGTTSPYAKLSVVGESVARNFTATSSTNINYFAGKTGIANNNPQATLSVKGALRVEDTDSITSGAGIEFKYDTSGSGGYIFPFDYTAVAYKMLTLRGNPLIFNDLGNNVGVGATSTPGSLFSVQGQALANNYVAYSTTSPSIFPQASTTQISSTIASSTFFYAGFGSAAQPSYTFGTNLGTGIYRTAANSIGFSTGGSNKLTIAATIAPAVSVTTGTSRGYLLPTGAGTVGAPSYSFQSNSTTGMWTLTGTSINLSSAGVEIFRADTASTSVLVGNFGVGTSSPYAIGSFVGASGVVADHFVSTSTTAASSTLQNTTTGGLRATNYYSNDGTVGFTGTCTIVGLTSIIVKNGLVVSCN